MVVYERAMWLMRMCMCVCAHAHTCARVCAHMCVSVIREIKHPFQDNTISRSIYTLYTRRISLIYVMWDYFFVLICAGDVVSRGGSDRVI